MLKELVARHVLREEARAAHDAGAQPQSWKKKKVFGHHREQK